MKIETKNNLWRCDITRGCYSDKSHTVVIVSGNTIDEAVNALKIYYQNTTDIEESYMKGLVIKSHGYDENWQYSKNHPMDTFSGLDFTDSNYGYVEDVFIEQLTVVYVGDEIARKTL